MVAIEAADVNTKLQIGAGDGGQCALEWVTRILVSYHLAGLWTGLAAPAMLHTCGSNVNNE